VRPGLSVDAFAAYHRRGSEAFALTEEVNGDDDDNDGHADVFIQRLTATHEVPEHAEAGVMRDEGVGMVPLELAHAESAALLSTDF
jgi:hypothetical protein